MTTPPVPAEWLAYMQANHPPSPVVVVKAPIVVPPLPDVHRITYGQLGASSSEPLWGVGSGQTKIFLGSDDPANAHYANLTAAGAANNVGVLRLAPNPSPLISGAAVDSTTADIATTGGKANGPRLINKYNASGATQEGTSWGVYSPGAVAASKYLVRNRWFKLSGTPVSPTDTFAVKWARFPLTSAGGGAAPQWSTHNSLPYVGAAGTVWQFYNTFTDEINPYPQGHDQGTQPFGPHIQDLFDGVWHRETILYKSHTSSGNKDGRSIMWIDGVQIVNVCSAALGGVGITPSGGIKQWCGQDMVDNMSVNDAAATDFCYEVGGLKTEGTGVQIDTDLPTFVVFSLDVYP